MNTKDVFDVLMSNDIGGKINSSACVIADDHIQIHFWNGERYKLSLTQEPDGCAYDPKTGLPISA